MKSPDTSRVRWQQLFSENSAAVDLRQATIEGTNSPCEGGLRSVCWKAFLLFGPLSQTTWPKKLAESRSAYTSLREHFLRYINNPDDLQSNVDPLSDDTSSPWASLRSDEINREEILQDVQRCMQDNFFFRDPVVQGRMLDILFIYSKLNPDLGYRQGMHELLAPILWVVDSDAIDADLMPTKQKQRPEDQFMTLVLDKECVEHDAFSLFCALMQTAKLFYEAGGRSGTSPLMSQCATIHESLSTVDPELADHLQVIGILPQVYLIRWIRLLFGREFGFNDVLELWDVLFASKVNLETVDAVCLVMLLHVRWQLIDADYSTALNILLRYQLPAKAGKARDLVKHALRLQKSLSANTGSMLIKEFSGKQPRLTRPYDMERPPPTPPRPMSESNDTPAHRKVAHGRDRPQRQSSPGQSHSRSSSRQQNLETIIKQVSSGLHRKADSWGVPKAVFGAADEVRRNLNSLYPTPSPRHSMEAEPVRPNAMATSDAQEKVRELANRINALETRNKALAKMLDSVISSLRQGMTSGSESDQKQASDAENDLNISLAKLQFICVYLSDIDMPFITTEDADAQEAEIQKCSQDEQQVKEYDIQNRSAQTSPSEVSATEELPPSLPPRAEGSQSPDISDQPTTSSEPVKPKVPVRPSLADSSFSFMLGENRHRSSFVSSVADLPQEARRGSEVSTNPKGGGKLWADTERPKDKRPKDKRPSIQAKDADGFTMQSFLGTPAKKD